MAMISMGIAVEAQAGAHSEALSQCLIRNTNDADKAVMTKWVFTAMSNHPSLTDMAAISSSMRTGVDQEMARVVEKFMYQSCTEELKQAVKNEGPGALQSSIRSYVEVMGREVMQHPSLRNSVTGLTSQFDYKKMFEALMSN